MSKLTTHNLKSLFDIIENNSSLVLWIRSVDYQRQLYVSPSYEKIWGQKTELLHEHPESWNDFLYTDDKQQMLTTLKTRVANENNGNFDKLLFRIINSENEVKYIKDTPYQLVDENNNIVAFAGISEVLTDKQWFEEHSTYLSLETSAKDQLKNYVFNILRHELKLQTTELKFPENDLLTQSDAKYKYILNDSNQQLQLSDREAECLFHLISGKSAKLTADAMSISTRTVEFHINNIKKKTGCKTKLQIISKIINSSS